MSVPPSKYVYPENICLCWHHKDDHDRVPTWSHPFKAEGKILPGCDVCPCKKFREPPERQIRRRKTK